MSQLEPEMQSTGNPHSTQRTLRDLRRMPRGSPCFSYSPDLPPGIRSRDAAERVLRSLPRMPRPCFSYSDGMPPSGRPGLPEGRLCFSY